jgi:hypothetical protein
MPITSPGVQETVVMRCCTNPKIWSGVDFSVNASGDRWFQT